RPRTAEVWVNGVRRALRELAPEAGAPFERTLAIELEAGIHDAWLVCLVHGDGVGHPAWPLLNDYTLAATNPVYLDGDGDGAYRSPRATARALLEARGDGPEALSAIVAESEEAVALQALDLAREAWARAADQRLKQAAGEPSIERERLRAWLDGYGARSRCPAISPRAKRGER
ncbi:MAG TPA: hypothetical protein VMT18_12885, partial [Planctomycetota bacterium]|nr:hypothetical protein [Planctomycetota bacterium]